MHPLHSLLSIASREERLAIQCPGQLLAFVRVHLPDGFQNYLPGDLGALQQFAFLAFFGLGVHQGGCRRMTSVALDRLEVTAGLQ